MIANVFMHVKAAL